MMKRLRNSARPASTWFGGTPVRPSAFRVSASTTKILVKLVIISSSAGATDSTVSASRTTIELLGRAVDAVEVDGDRRVGPVGRGRVGRRGGRRPGRSGRRTRRAGERARASSASERASSGRRAGGDAGPGERASTARRRARVGGGRPHGAGGRGHRRAVRRCTTSTARRHVSGDRTEPCRAPPGAARRLAASHAGAAWGRAVVVRVRRTGRGGRGRPPRRPARATVDEPRGSVPRRPPVAPSRTGARSAPPPRSGAPRDVDLGRGGARPAPPRRRSRTRPATSTSARPAPLPSDWRPSTDSGTVRCLRTVAAALEATAGEPDEAEHARQGQGDAQAEHGGVHQPAACSGETISVMRMP